MASVALVATVGMGVGVGAFVDEFAERTVVDRLDKAHRSFQRYLDSRYRLLENFVAQVAQTPLLKATLQIDEIDAATALELAKQTLDVLTFQIRAGLVGCEPKDLDRLVIAYEPVWAIGTGRVATPTQAQDAHLHLRNELRDLSGPSADKTRIIYGGSMKPDNAAEIMAQPDVDGGLVGGASLEADSFLAIVGAALAAR